MSISYHRYHTSIRNVRIILTTVIIHTYRTVFSATLLSTGNSSTTLDPTPWNSVAQAVGCGTGEYFFLLP